MEGAVSANCISIFNFVAVFIAILTAVLALVSIIGKRVGFDFLSGRTLLHVFGVASLCAIILEVTLFNYPHHYSKYSGAPDVHFTEVSPEDSTVFLTSDGTAAQIVDSFLVFKDLDRKVSSLFLACDFKESELAHVNVQWTNEIGSSNSIIKTLYKHMPHENYTILHTMGAVSELKVMVIRPADTTVVPADIIGVGINKTIPLYFSGLRVFAITCLFFVIILFAHKRLRIKTAYYLFEYKFDQKNKKQKIIYALCAALLILFSFICAYTSVTEDETQAKQYNKYLVDALIAGRAHLEAGNPEKLLNAERPYDLRWLDENRDDYKRDVDWFGDWVYYNGKFYCYFGAVPALMLYVPYKMITGNYLSNHGGIFLFAAASIILLGRLWRLFVKKYLPDSRFAFYLLSFFTLFFATGLFNPLRFTRFYSIVAMAGFMFVIAGCLLLFESIERVKIDRSKLFLACMCFALAVGCRPNLLFASLIVPVILWKYRLWKHLPLVIIPYIIVAIPMCIYNYVRFDSIFDFGVKYNMTNLNVAQYSLHDTSAKIINTFVASVSYLFTLNKYSFFFPYVECLPNHRGMSLPIILFYDRGCGMINFPIVFCLFYFFRDIFRRERQKTFYISSTFLAIAAVLIFLNSWLIGFSGRYMMDFAVFIIFPSLFCAYYWCGGSSETCEYQKRFRLKVTYVLLALSVFVGLFLFATQVTNDATPYNQVIYRYLHRSLGLFGTV